MKGFFKHYAEFTSQERRTASILGELLIVTIVLAVFLIF